MIADFPDPAAGSDAEATYRIDAIARLVAAAHEAGARVAVHSTVPDAGQLVAVGVDSVEHGFGLDERAVRDMADRGTAWTPTVGALLALLDAPGMTPERRHRLQEGRARVAGLLPLAVRLGVPVLAGTDVTGSIPRGGGAAAAQMGLEPEDALAAASTWPRRFLGDANTADIVTYGLDVGTIVEHTFEHGVCGVGPHCSFCGTSTGPFSVKPTLRICRDSGGPRRECTSTRQPRGASRRMAPSSIAMLSRGLIDRGQRRPPLRVSSAREVMW